MCVCVCVCGACEEVEGVGVTPARTMEARLASDKLLLAAGCQAAAAAMTTGVSKLASGRTGKNTNKKKKTRRSHDAEPWQAQAPFLPALGGGVLGDFPLPSLGPLIGSYLGELLPHGTPLLPHRTQYLFLFRNTASTASTTTR